jgi:hypothetical protein
MIAVVLSALIAINNQGILEYGHVVSFKAVEHDDDLRFTTLELTGHIIDSSLKVGPITTKIESSSLTVMVHLILFWPGSSGNFKYDFVVPNSIKEVRFGENDVLVWRRS